MSNIFQHVKNSGKPRSLHPTWYDENWKSELTCNIILPNTQTELLELMQEGDIYSSPETAKDVESVQSQGYQR